MTFLQVQGQRDYAQLVRMDNRSGKTYSAANLRSSIVDAMNGNFKWVHSSIVYFQRSIEGSCWEGQHLVHVLITTGKLVPRSWIPICTSFSSYDPKQDLWWALGYCMILIIGAPFAVDSFCYYTVYLIVCITLSWNIHHVVGENRWVLNCNSKWWWLYHKDTHEVQSEAVNLPLWEGQKRLPEETLEPISWTENHEEPGHREKDRWRQRSNSAISQLQLVQGLWSTDWERVSGGSKSHWGFLSRDAAWTSLLFSVVGSCKGGLEERGAG